MCINQINQLIKQWLPEIIQIRHQLHQIPELKFAEFKTSALIADFLQSDPISIQTGIAKTGVVATIDSGKPGKTIALRADMDALPIQELTALSYQSQHENKMHACGHDGHVATLLLVTKILYSLRETFSGIVKLIFQPAEEGGKGSLAMINEGVLKNVDAIFGYHNWPSLALGKVGTKSGTILAGTGRFEITIYGKVAHSAMPEQAINPVTFGAKIIIALEELRKQLSSQSIIINIIRFENGEMKGGMTDSAKIIGIYYLENNQVLTELQNEVTRQISTILQNTGTHYQVDFIPFHEPTVNSQKETHLLLATAKDILEPQDVIEFTHFMIAAEDFSEYLKVIPGCFFLVGAGEESPAVHTAYFDFPDAIIPIAASVMTQTAIYFLNEDLYA